MSQNSPVGSVRAVVGRTLRAPVSRRAGAELAYVVGAPLALPGAGQRPGVFPARRRLGDHRLGHPGAGGGGPGCARPRTGTPRTGPYASPGEAVTAPAAFQPGHGLFAWIRTGLRDSAGWRAIAWLLAGLPLALLGLSVVLVTWAWGLVALTYPLQHALGLNQMAVVGADGKTRQGLVLDGVVFDTWPRLLLVSAGGARLVVVAAWAVRGVVLLDQLLIRTLLAADRASQRIADLRRTRAHAVDDAAATLRRIERDLHDGVQAHLVALGMNDP